MSTDPTTNLLGRTRRTRYDRCRCSHGAVAFGGPAHHVVCVSDRTKGQRGDPPPSRTRQLPRPAGEGGGAQGAPRERERAHFVCVSDRTKGQRGDPPPSRAGLLDDDGAFDRDALNRPNRVLGPGHDLDPAALAALSGRRGPGQAPGADRESRQRRDVLRGAERAIDQARRRDRRGAGSAARSMGRPRRRSRPPATCRCRPSERRTRRSDPRRSPAARARDLRSAPATRRSGRPTASGARSDGWAGGDSLGRSDGAGLAVRSGSGLEARG